jgi:hypothetical protein
MVLTPFYPWTLTLATTSDEALVPESRILLRALSFFGEHHKAWVCGACGDWGGAQWGLLHGEG